MRKNDNEEIETEIDIEKRGFVTKETPQSG